MKKGNKKTLEHKRGIIKVITYRTSHICIIKAIWYHGEVRGNKKALYLTKQYLKSYYLHKTVFYKLYIKMVFRKFNTRKACILKAKKPLSILKEFGK
jgi:hypothetical protein